MFAGRANLGVHDVLGSVELHKFPAPISLHHAIPLNYTTFEL